MARSALKGMAMRGVVSCLPENEVVNNRDYPWFDQAEVRKITAVVGVNSRRMADSATCTSDLCFVAAKKLVERLDWDPASVDGLIMVTQTPDYIMPSTSCILQERLGLSQECASFDVSLGCSAYVYGLWLAHSLLSARSCNRILLLAGDTPSKYVNPKDRATALLFGDAGTATALEWTEADQWTAHYILKTDGKGYKDLIIPGGGFRERFPQDENQSYVYMDGGHVFDFTRTCVPALIQEMFAFAGKGARDYDYYVFHQSNEYLLKFIASKSGIEMARVPLAMSCYGNTSAASVPLTLATVGWPAGEKDAYTVMFLGYGVGLSWGAASLNIPRACLFDRLVLENSAH